MKVICLLFHGPPDGMLTTNVTISSTQLKHNLCTPSHISHNIPTMTKWSMAWHRIVLWPTRRWYQ